MSVPNIAISGVQAYGVIIGTSGVLTINGTAYKVNNWKPDRGVEMARQNNPNGTISTWRATAANPTATADLQLSTDATTYPKFGDTVTITSDANYGAELWAIMPVSVEQSNSPTETRIMPLKLEKVTDAGNYSTAS